MQFIALNVHMSITDNLHESVCDLIDTFITIEFDVIVSLRHRNDSYIKTIFIKKKLAQIYI